jgi:hypothetical protein
MNYSISILREKVMLSEWSDTKFKEMYIKL